MTPPKKTRTGTEEQARSAEEGSGGPSLGSFIRRQRELANLSLRKLAQQSGVSAAILREIESGLRNPSQTILQSVAAALRLSAETLQLQAGVLDPRKLEEIPVVREILRDPHLTERQREILHEIYASFRVCNAHGGTNAGNKT